MRCLTLAREFSALGAEVKFFCREVEGDLNYFIKKQGYDVLTYEATVPVGKTEARWSLEAQNYDAQVLAGHIDEKVDWIVVDHYGLDEHWERAVRGVCKKLLCIDDLANRMHDCDFLLDQNGECPGGKNYTDKLSRRAVKLIGPQYALLNNQFKVWRDKRRLREGRVDHVLVFMGSGDLYNSTQYALQGLINSGFKGSIDVVLGSSNRHSKLLEHICKHIHRARIHVQVDNMAELMHKADLSLGAAGATTWERACLGLPTLAVTLAQNQVPIAQYAASHGLLFWLGDHGVINADDWAQAIRSVLDGPELCRQMSINGASLVDGNGVARVMKVLI